MDILKCFEPGALGNADKYDPIASLAKAVTYFDTYMRTIKFSPVYKFWDLKANCDKVKHIPSALERPVKDMEDFEFGARDCSDISVRGAPNTPNPQYT